VANRYWVGGAGTWNTVSTTNWSASSGGASGASVPTAADSVIFDQAGTYTVTMTGALLCLDFTVSLGTVTFATGTSPTLAVTGSMTLLIGTVWSSTGTITFNATTTGKTVTTNGVTISAAITFNGVGGGWTLGSALTLTGSLTFTAGAFDTGNYALTGTNSGTSIQTSGTLTKSVSLGSSTVTLSGGWNFSAATNLTLTAGTSLISIPSEPGKTFAGGGLSYYDLSWGSASGNNTTNQITGANSFRNLTLTSRTGYGNYFVSLSADQTVTGLFTANAGATITYRVVLISSTKGTARTITAASVSLVNYSFQDITLAGAAAPGSGTNLGDAGGNSGLTFATPKTVYWSLVGGGAWQTATAWATTAGGTPATANFPLPQDTATIVDTGLNAAATITGEVLFTGTIDASARTLAATLTLTNVVNYFTGDINLSTAVTFNGSISVFLGRGSQIIRFTSAYSSNFTFDCASGSYALQNSISVGSVTHTSGTLNLQTYTLTAGSFASNNSTVRTLAFGTGNIVVNGTGTVWNTGTPTNLTVTGTPVVNVSNNTATATTVSTGSPTEANSISFNFTTGTYALTFSSGTVRSLNFTGFAGTMANTNKTIYGNLTLAAAYTAGTNRWMFAGTSGTQTITSGGFTVDWPLTFDGVGGTFALGGTLTVGSTRLTTLTNGTLDLAGFTYSTGTFATAFGTKNITFNAGTLTVTGSGATAFDNAKPTNFTTTAGTGTGYISMSSATAKTFVGGGSTFNATLTQSGAGALTITGSNSFANLTNTTQPVSILFTAATTTTFTSGFSLAGTAGNLVTIGSVTAASHTLSKASGTVSVSYCTISQSTATGGASWQALTSNGNVDGGNNTGWNFGNTNYPITANSGTYALTGQSATITKTRLITANNGTYALTGQSATITKTRLITANNGTYALTGQSATITKTTAYVITANNGTYALTGRSATITKTRLITANNGTYALTGRSATITKTRLITANNGTYSLTGQSATITKTRLITANNGTYALTGRTATITYTSPTAYVITANNGTYALTGQSATIIKTRLITANNGTYALTGRSATITKTRLITANNGTYSLTGQSATIAKTRLITANSGTYALTGQSATISKTRLITANNGVYAITGQSATITYALFANYAITALSGSYSLSGQTANITYTASPIIITDTHDGDYHKKIKKRFDKENQRLKKKREDIIEAYERIVEGKPALAKQLIDGFEVKDKNTDSKEQSTPSIDFDKFLKDLDRVERLWNEYLEMEDEDLMVLL